MSVDKKMAAVIGTAVSAYLEAERAEQAAARSQPPVPAQRLRLWGQAGRQDIMRNRQMWQLRIVPR
jgi:hypothetical protein